MHIIAGEDMRHFTGDVYNTENLVFSSERNTNQRFQPFVTYNVSFGGTRISRKVLQHYGFTGLGDSPGYSFSQVELCFSYKPVAETPMNAVGESMSLLIQDEDASDCTVQYVQA